ncbi:gamma glutamyl hydrolase [Trichuris trichiura]|uniref:folate gamma-glutamyl hydrolase n=1 Tax=Trichuris trichiura TaxID=36087 RepID=A0A077ZD59_TRITR|nr:gamma glutamyl hydrolase [Trichuris trichiura]
MVTLQGDPNWADTLPVVLIGMCVAFEPDIGTSAAELVLGETIILPGQYFVIYRIAMEDFPVLHHEPVIGMLAVHGDFPKLGEYSLPASYVRNVQSAGARVVPILPGESLDYYKRLFSQLNGLFIPGGPGKPTGHQKEVTKTASYFYKWAIEAFNCGQPKYWPIWGTCLGFQILATITSNSDCLMKCHCQAGSYSATLKVDPSRSRLLSSLSPEILTAITSECICPHVHAYCLSLETFYRSHLNDFYVLLASNKDRNGLEYVVGLEARDHPIFALMSHQEKVCHTWNPRYQFDRSENAVRLSQELMNFFVRECCRNDNKFGDWRTLAENCISGYRSTFMHPHDGSLDEYYFFEQSS